MRCGARTPTILTLGRKPGPVRGATRPCDDVVHPPQLQGPDIGYDGPEPVEERLLLLMRLERLLGLPALVQVGGVPNV